MGSRRGRPDARDSQAAGAGDRPSPGARRRGPVLALALLGAVVVSGLLAQPALAVRKVNIIFSCEKITYQYSGFPEVETPNVITEQLRADGTTEFNKEKFEFTGSSGENTITLKPPLTAGMHKLTAEARWKTNGVVGESGKHREHVSCAGAEQPEFAIQTLQEIAGASGGFTPQELTGRIGQTVDYQITVTNTGNTTLKLSEFVDTGCDPGTLSGPEDPTLAPGGKAVYRCSHLLTGGGSYTNVASATATYGEDEIIAHDSESVVVKVVLEPRLSLSMTQEIKGSGAGFTSSNLTATIGDTILYRVTAKNTGNVALTISEPDFTDVYCSGISGGPTVGALAPGDAAVYSCSHKLTAIPEGGYYVNVAFIMGTGEGGAKAEEASNAVNVKVTEAGAPGTSGNPPATPPGNGMGTTGTLGGGGSGSGSTGTLGTKAKKSVKKHVHKVTVAHKTPRFTG